jgi:hypothetical protein
LFAPPRRQCSGLSLSCPAVEIRAKPSVQKGNNGRELFPERVEITKVGLDKLWPILVLDMFDAGNTRLSKIYSDLLAASLIEKVTLSEQPRVARV